MIKPFVCRSILFTNLHQTQHWPAKTTAYMLRFLFLIHLIFQGRLLYSIHTCAISVSRIFHQSGGFVGTRGGRNRDN